MLNNVPSAINRMARNVVINHPNTFNCVVIRKRVTRTAPETIGGLPTIGGIGVISSDDEESIAWDTLGNGYALPAEGFQPSQMMDRQDANNGAVDEYRFLIEPEVVDAFDISKNDVFYLIIDVVRLAYEVVSMETTSNIPPYTPRCVCNRRNDLDFTI